jgi:TRAP-type C4-dicarboxylate transport system substrate-binding protein
MKKYATIAIALAASVGAMSAHAQNVKLAHGFPPSHTVVTKGFEPFMTCVQEGSNNQVPSLISPAGR